MVRITRNPQAVEKNSQFPGDRHDGPFLAVLTAPFEHSRTPAFEVTVRAKTSQLDTEHTEPADSGDVCCRPC